MKKYLISASIISGIAISTLAPAQNLLQVYHDALANDPSYANAVATAKEAAQATPQAFAALLPAINFTGSAGLARTTTDGSLSTPTPNSTATTRSIGYEIDLAQPLFNFSAWAGLAVAHNSVKAAYATLSAAQQNLMQRTSSAFFQVLTDKALLSFALAQKNALNQSYRQAKDEFEVGTSTITDVDQAKAAYEGAVSSYIAAENTLATDKEALSAITGVRYKTLTPLGEVFPLVHPVPDDINDWVSIALKQNWAIVASRYNMFAAKDAIHAQWGQHLPSLGADVNYQSATTHLNGGSSQTIKGPAASLALTFPVFNAGVGPSSLVNSVVKQYVAKYEESQANFTLTARTQIQNTRQFFLSVSYGVSQVNADRNTVIADLSALKSTQAGYQVGTQTMMDVLTAEQTLYQGLSTYATARYAYVNSVIALKAAAGTLDTEDLESINSWLNYPKPGEKTLFNQVQATRHIDHDVTKAKAPKKAS